MKQYHSHYLIVAPHILDKELAPKKHSFCSNLFFIKSNFYYHATTIYQLSTSSRYYYSWMSYFLCGTEFTIFITPPISPSSVMLIKLLFTTATTRHVSYRHRDSRYKIRTFFQETAHFLTISTEVRRRQCVEESSDCDKNKF